MTQQTMFTPRYLRMLILPLVVEQFLAVTIGMADTVMVASSGEAAVSAVSLVDSFGQLMIALFSSFATGGSVVCSQYLGQKNEKVAGDAAKQLYNISLVFSLALLILIPFRKVFLAFLFGHIEEDVMRHAINYFFWVLLSYPFLAIYNSITAMYRSMGNSKLSLKVSLLMNIINIGGNAALIYGAKLSVVGAGIATLVSRMVAAVVLCYLITHEKSGIRLSHLFQIRFEKQMVFRILRISVPSGIENSLFQVGKLIVQNFIAAFGTVSLAANAICNSIASFANIPGGAFALASITVVGQCMGAGKSDEAFAYGKKLLGLTYLCMGVTATLIFFFAPVIVLIFGLSAEATAIALSVLRQCMIATIIIWPMAFELPNALRAAGDAKYTMMVSMISMWCFRVFFAYILAIKLGLGLKGVWMGMYIDWAFRATCFLTRFLRGKWREKRII